MMMMPMGQGMGMPGQQGMMGSAAAAPCAGGCGAASDSAAPGGSGPHAGLAATLLSKGGFAKGAAGPEVVPPVLPEELLHKLTELATGGEKKKKKGIDEAAKLLLEEKGDDEEEDEEEEEELIVNPYGIDPTYAAALAQAHAQEQLQVQESIVA